MQLEVFHLPARGAPAPPPVRPQPRTLLLPFTRPGEAAGGFAPSGRIALPRPGELPPVLRFTGELYPFQRAGVAFARAHGGRALIADEMGLGKTVQALAYLAQAGPDALPVLILAPGAVLSQWEGEIARFLSLDVYPPEPGADGPRRGRPLKVHRLTGLNAQPLPPADCYLAHYDLIPPRQRGEDAAPLPGRAPDLQAAGFRSLILDEMQALRHRETARFRALRALTDAAKPAHVLGLSGTPLYNYGGEFWPLLRLLRPDLAGTFASFDREWLYSLGHGRSVLKRPREFGELLRREVMIRRVKRDVAAGLPPKRRVHQAVAVQSTGYDAVMAQIAEEFYSGGEPPTISGRFARNMGALSRERHATALLKVQETSAWLAGMLRAEPDKRVVLFAHHQGAFAGYAAKLAEFNPARYTGAESTADRAEAAAAFKSGESRVLIAALRVAGLGLNLQHADTVVFAEFDWSPAVHLQAEDRCHRLGQQREVSAFYCYAPGTLDGYILQLCAGKLRGIEAVLDRGAQAPQDGGERLTELAAAELERRLGRFVA